MTEAGLLDYQQARRGRGVPTVAALVGPGGLGVRAWRAWAAARDRAATQTAAPDAAGVARAWVARALAGGDAERLARDWLAARGGAVPARPTLHDLDRLWATRAADRAEPAALAALAILKATAVGRIVGPEALVAEVAAGGRTPRDFAAPVVGVAGLLPEAARPALLVLPAAGPDAARAALKILEPIAVALPGLPVGVCVAAADFALLSGDGSRLAAMAREGEVRLAAVSGDELAEQLRAAGLDPGPLAAAIRTLSEGGLAPEVADAFVAAELETRAPPVGVDDTFRSAQERFLFAQLESMPSTAGLFRPNEALEFSHGHRLAEADLVARDLRLVIEVDGGYFHLTPVQYRRDRRKDYSYQTNGYLVLRFLAEDVVPELSAILTTILGAVAARRAAVNAEGSPNG